MLVDAQKQSFAADGFLVVLRVLPPDALADIQAEARKLADDESYNRRGEPGIDFPAE